MASPQLLVTDGVETVTFDGTDAWLMTHMPWIPATPNLRVRQFAQPGIDGAELDGSDYDNVAETIGATFIGGVATARLATQKLTRLLDHARLYRKPGIAKVWLKFRPDSSELWYRSQLLNGRILWNKLTLDWMWANGIFELDTMVLRRFYWEADVEVEVPLKRVTVSEAYATGGKNITDHEDADANHTNGVEIDASVLVGDLPAPARIVMQNASAGIDGTIFAGLEVEQVGPVTTTLEGEGATPLVNVADALSSGGNFNRVLWATAAETDLLTWATQLSTAQLANMAGRYFRVLARFANAPTYTDLWLRMKLTNPEGTILQTPKLLMKSGLQLQELGALLLPPHLSSDASLAALGLVLQAVRAGNATAPVNIASSTAANPSVVTTATPHGFASGQAVNIAGHLVNTAINGLWLITVTGASTFTVPVLGIGGGGGATGTVAQAAFLDLDCLLLIPLDGWRKYVPAFGGLSASDTLTDDPTNRDSLRSLQSGANYLKNYTVQGAPIMLVPGPFKQRLRFLWIRTSGLATIADLLTISVFYRGRRLTI